MQFNLFGDTYDVVYTIYLGNQPVERFAMSGPRPMLEAQFLSFVQQIANQKQPMRIVMERTEVIWDQFEQKQKPLSYTVEFQNYEEGI